MKRGWSGNARHATFRAQAHLPECSPCFCIQLQVPYAHLPQRFPLEPHLKATPKITTCGQGELKLGARAVQAGNNQIAVLLAGIISICL